VSNLFSGVFCKEKTISILVLCSLATMITFYGCEKNKGVESQPQPQVSPCDVFDKSPTDMKKRTDVNFENKVKLLGITANKSSENQLNISYYWQVLNDLGTLNTVFVHLTDQDNKVLVQNDHGFCQGKPSAELKGKFVKETFIVPIPPAAAGKEISIKLGFYDRIDPKYPRLKIENAGSASLDWENTRALVEKLMF
jgi:hypothetical protein